MTAREKHIHISASENQRIFDFVKPGNGKRFQMRNAFHLFI